MAGKPPGPPAPYDLLDRIRNVVRSIVLDISDQWLPSIYLDRYRNHCADPSGTCRCGYESAIGGEVISMEREGHARRLDVMLRVLLIVQGLLQATGMGLRGTFTI
ncbi:Meiotic recombination protein SPO11-1 [Acorus calamus]|uniref:Meiotic recombination protein SPO11-1 n=1 Tax=Acorus calamus TaxID=4465 RepID=A0AAV9D8Y7_ACOCL|nr:Meiotic recombination protein SPO11-1 [Acorus calamus]